MKTITLMFAAAALTFAQAPAAPTPTASKDATAAPVKKHSKKHAGKKMTTATPATTAAPAAK